MGCLLGDGCGTLAPTTSFSTCDPELVEALVGAFDGVEPIAKGDYDYVLRREGPRRGPLTNPVTAQLRAAGVAGTRSSNKFVPELGRASCRERVCQYV